MLIQGRSISGSFLRRAGCFRTQRFLAFSQEGESDQGLSRGVRHERIANAYTAIISANDPITASGSQKESVPLLPFSVDKADFETLRIVIKY